jgi:rfaE bifunctional protein nucleotidyltransferase chain/domain
MEKAVFLDRDGVLIEDTGYPHLIEEMKILPGASEAIKRLKKAGYLIVIVSNQSGIARGLFTEKEMEEFNRKLVYQLRKEGATIDAIYFCPHHPEGKVKKHKKSCECRKPKPGMLLKAAREHMISLQNSWMIGDKEDDIAAGKAVGCKTIKIDKKAGTDFSAKTLLEAVEIIFENETDGKLVAESKVERIIEEAKKHRKKVVFTNGCFDILHAGHVDYLKKAKALGDILVIGLNSDESVRKIKDPKRPINNEFWRAKVLSALECVDYIVIFNEKTPERLVEKLKPDIYVKGGDWKLSKLPEKKIVEKYGGEVVLIDIVEDISTSKIVEKVLLLYKDIY